LRLFHHPLLRQKPSKCGSISIHTLQLKVVFSPLTIAKNGSSKSRN
jgi:hypothetical protein